MGTQAKENPVKGAIAKKGVRKSPKDPQGQVQKTQTTNLLVENDVTIRLEVKAYQLFKLDGYNKTDINDLCKLTDGSSPDSDYGDDKSLFESEVSLNKYVYWIARTSGSAKDSVYKVEIKAYDYDENSPNNTNFFNESRIEENSGNVEGLVKNDINKDDIDTYLIAFRITNTKTKKWSDYIIDPKLKIKPQVFYFKPTDTDARTAALDEVIAQLPENN